jgi:thiol-disulfide isomerase/thioredoxin
VRTTICLGLVTLCLAPAGCSATGKKASTTSSGPRPFTGAADAPGAADSPAPPQEANGFLAGQVVDRFSHRPTDVRIQVVDLQDANPSKAARIDFQDVKDGYFMIQGLKPGRQYQLIARAKVGDKLLAGTTVAQPPNPRLSIYLSEDLAGPETPPITPNPTPPDKKPDPAVGKDGKPTGGVGATLDPPVKSDAGTPANPPASPTPAPPAASPEPATRPPATVIPLPSLDKFAEKEDPKRKNLEPADIPHAPPPGTSIPVPPGPTSRKDDPPAWAPVGGTTKDTTATTPGPVPSCQLFGKKLENFALYGLDGQPWEYRRDHRGKVVLIDFWSTTCTPCLNAIPELKRLEKTYGPYGLEVVGIAYEKGPVDKQVEKVRNVRIWQGMNYTVLLGGSDSCPVRAQFRVNAFPTLVLIDGKGEGVWRKEGLDEDGRYELEMEIRKRLGMR